MTLKDHGKFEEKLTIGFQFGPRKILPISLKRARRVKNSNFMGFFCLNGTLVQPKTVVGLETCDTEGPWKVWGKTNSGFPIQPKKNWVKFRRAGEKVKFSNFIDWLCLKDTLLVQQIDTAVSCPDTEGPCTFKLFF